MQRYCLIGFPVEHSESPGLHNTWFRDLGIDAHYELNAVAPDTLPAFMQRFRDTFAGANVTVPHKAAIMMHLDRIDPDAAAIGAVNTIVRNQDELIGFNTDWVGALLALAEGMGAQYVPGGARSFLHGKHVLILGAGGAARAVAHAVTGACAQLTLANRTLAHAQELAERYGDHAIGLEQAAVTGADIVINTTSVGLWPHSDATPLPLSAWQQLASNPDLVVMDAVAKPEATRFLREAESSGARLCIPGRRMLIHQAALSFALWTGKPPPT